MESTQNIQIVQGIDWNSLIYWGVTILITNLATWYISNQKSKYNFKLEYHKMIIEKRMKAYDELQILINELDQNFVFDSVDGQHLVHYIFDKSDLLEIKRLMLETFKYTLWYSNEMKQLFTRLNKLFIAIDEIYLSMTFHGLNNYIKEYSDDIENPILLDEEKIKKITYLTSLRPLGALVYDELEGIIVEMRRMVSVDLKSFYKVEDFLENQSPN